jgi:hypothetical protein
MLTTRRGLITGLAAFLAAPAIVRISSLMPVKAFATAEEVFWSAPLQLPPSALQYRQEFIRVFEESVQWLRHTSNDQAARLFQS